MYLKSMLYKLFNNSKLFMRTWKTRLTIPVVYLSWSGDFERVAIAIAKLLAIAIAKTQTRKY